MATAAPARAVGPAACIRLGQSGLEHRDEKRVDPVDAAENARIPATEDCIRQEIPCRADSRADFAVVRVIRVFGVVIHVADAREANLWIISNALKRRLLNILRSEERRVGKECKSRGW